MATMCRRTEAERYLTEFEMGERVDPIGKSLAVSDGRAREKEKT